MTQAGQTPDEILPPSLLAAAQRLVGAKLTSAAAVSGSGNSRICRIETDAAVYALKAYPGLGEDQRDRLGREFAALVFLQGQGKWDVPVPVPLAADKENRLGLYSWLDGVRPLPAADPDLAVLAGIVRKFRDISAAPGAAAVPNAVEATVSAMDLTQQIAARLEKLRPVRPQETELEGFLERSFAPRWTLAQARMTAVYADSGHEPGQPISHSQRVLSPSDFGLHNSLRLAHGGLALLDFEYFGWDDPVRLIADVLCHPAMALVGSQRREFAEATIPVFAGDPAFLSRLTALAPLIALRWALIVLNEFLPDHWARRVLAGAVPDWPAAKRRQLDKAWAMLGLCDEFLVIDWK